MKTILLLLIAACELQPPPKQAPKKTETAESGSAVGSAAGSAAPAPAAGSAEGSAGSGAGSAGSAAAPPKEYSAECVAAASHVADVLITSAKDPQLKASYEQGRSRIVLATEEACSTQKWPPDQIKCYSTAKTEAELRDCEKKFPPPGARPPEPPKPPKPEIPKPVQPKPVQPNP